MKVYLYIIKLITLIKLWYYILLIGASILKLFRSPYYIEKNTNFRNQRSIVPNLS